MNKDIVPVSHPITSSDYSAPVKKESCYKGTIKAILNAYNETVSFDNTGVMWIERGRVSDILRTTKANAKYIITNLIEDDGKMIYLGKQYVRGYDLKKLIDKEIQELGLGKKKEYLKFSEEVYNAIRDCPMAENLRNAYFNTMMENRKLLKKARIKAYKIKEDELTKKSIKATLGEFSHIRSVALFKDYAQSIDNGLIVSKATHKIITREGVNDEEELLELCKNQGWDTGWYSLYKEIFC